VHVLQAEAEPEPGIDQRRVASGDKDVLHRAALVHPTIGRARVQIPYRLDVLEAAVQQRGSDPVAPMEFGEQERR